jgi:hypothetical protein
VGGGTVVRRGDGGAASAASGRRAGMEGRRRKEKVDTESKRCGMRKTRRRVAGCMRKEGVLSRS